MKEEETRTALKQLNHYHKIVKLEDVRYAMNNWIFANRQYKGANDVVHEVQLRTAERTLDKLPSPIYLDEEVSGITRHYRTPFNGNIYHYLNYLAKNNGTVLNVRDNAY
jgi:hypothetical protein